MLIYNQKPIYKLNNWSDVMIYKNKKTDQLKWEGNSKVNDEFNVKGKVTT